MMADLFDLDKIHSTNNLDRWYKEAWLGINMGGGEMFPDLSEPMNDQDFTDSPEIAGSDYSDTGLGLREYWVDTPSERDKVIFDIGFYYDWDANAFDLDLFGGGPALTNGWSIFWDREFNFGTIDNPIFVPVRLFQVDPIRTNQDLKRFLRKGMFDYEVVKRAGFDAIFVEGEFALKTGIRLRKQEGFPGDRFGVTLNDDFTVGLNTFQIRLDGFSIFKDRTIL
jgi:hypothetical protein